jgi:DNA (cytosine-5)-methyltransferase 1
VVVRVTSQLGRDYGQYARKAGRTHIARNELVLTDEFHEVSAERIGRRCDILFVPKDDVLKGKVPFPYDRDGAGDFWYISMGVATIDSTTRHLVFLDKLPDEFRNGRAIEDLLRHQKLSGLSIFGGGGNLDRGLEDGGAIEFQTVVDYDEHAIHTQWANARHRFDVHLYCGSVDDYLQQLLSGRWQEGDLIAKIGTVLIVVAGAPCPGFSTLQKNFQSLQSLRNSSHVTSMPSYVDMYRPEYGIFENVPNMASTRTGFEDQNVLSQLIACFVAMGYQVSQFLMDSWSYGSCQQRSRLFLAITAPGLEPILQPPHTHSRPYGEASARSLGQLPNGQRFGESQHYPTPFDFMSAGDATADLPDIGNANVQTCIAFPDHRVTVQPGYMRRKILEYIPRQPPGCGYKEAFKLGLIPPALQKPGKELGKAFRRISKEGLIPTITTRISPQDAHNGAAVHWDQDRSITLQEARRAQGYPDHEVIIGRPADQLRIVGNGVDRKVAFALGLSLRASVEKNWAAREAAAMAQMEKEILVDVEDAFVGLEGEVLVDAEDALVGIEGVVRDQGWDDGLQFSFSKHTSNTGALYQQRGESVTLRLKRTREEVTVFSGDSVQKPAKRRKT